MQHAFVEDAPELGATRSVQNVLPGHPGGHLLLQIGRVAVQVLLPGELKVR